MIKEKGEPKDLKVKKKKSTKIPVALYIQVFLK